MGTVDTSTVVLGLAAAPFITALLQMLKPFVKDARLYPLMAIAVGVLWNVGFTVGTDEFSRATVFLGLAAGLSASGLYSAVAPGVELARDRLNGEPPADR